MKRALPCTRLPTDVLHSIWALADTGPSAAAAEGRTVEHLSLAVSPLSAMEFRRHSMALNQGGQGVLNREQFFSVLRPVQ